MPTVGLITGHFPHLCAHPMLAQLSVPPPPCHKGRGFPLEEPIQQHVSITLALAWSCQCLSTHTHRFAANKPDHHPQVGPPKEMSSIHISPFQSCYVLWGPDCTDDPLPSSCLNPLWLMKFEGRWFSMCHHADREEQVGLWLM